MTHPPQVDAGPLEVAFKDGGLASGGRQPIGRSPSNTRELLLPGR